MDSLREPNTRLAGRLRGLAFVLLVSVTAAGCDSQGQAPEHQMPPPVVNVAEVIAEPVTLWESFNGRVVAPETVELRPRVSGYIDKVAFEEGELVQAGDLLFQIDPRPYRARARAARAELARAKSQLALAKTEAGRAKPLLDKRAISREEYDRREATLASAEAQVSAARAALESAELQLSYTRVTAPVSGRTGRAMITRGNLASADQTLLTTLVSVNPMHVYFDADEQSALDSQQILDAESATAVRIGLAGDSGFPYRGTLDFIDNRLDPGTGTLQYRAELANPEGAFRPGQFVRVQLPVAKLEQALLVNRKAVLTDQDRRYVFVVDANNTAARRQITPGRTQGELLVIRDGLNSGDRVVVSGVQKIFADGMPVEPQQVAMRSREAAVDTALASVGP
ncbi:efflux RND transporter periplasmic adaptor subunit [Microbulbifer litoralis]|uniref:efflux RND transporter periplasmic adaptor subunit n=1 Tax=Microbulbifer litoralis TaxID=2933965 RepID=UPI0020284627|nr:efflux RND transporter periplasmic adaptor subunit [Microbulbifer sp. GX H0434]